MIMYIIKSTEGLGKFIDVIGNPPFLFMWLPPALIHTFYSWYTNLEHKQCAYNPWN